MTDTTQASATPAASLPGVKPVAHFPKQAVVVIHGIGEQMPMDTIRGFVRAVWQTDSAVTGNAPEKLNEVWSKPDRRTGSLELRRITTGPTVDTPAFPTGARTDFYELYWADLSSGSTWSEIEGWITRLLLRNPLTRVPPDVRPAWVLLWIVTVAILILAAATMLPREPPTGLARVWGLLPVSWFGEFPKWASAALAALGGFAVQHALVPYVGRVVRYTRAKPENIAARKNIRERGLALLDQLHGGDYERVILVGHSLGSIVAYDLISYFWASRPETHTIEVGTPEFDALRELEAANAAVGTSNCNPVKVNQFRTAQRRFCGLLRRRRDPKTRWLVTDLVTLGSPLTHAEFLLANSKADLELMESAREFPKSPPLREVLDSRGQSRAEQDSLSGETALSCFPTDDTHWQLHHAAPFAAVSWTNIHDPASFVFLGDLISGPLAPMFGAGVTDIDLKEVRGKQSRTFTHTCYWELGRHDADTKRVVALRGALDLPGKKLL